MERFLPELANRRVLRHVEGPLDDTVPAARSITIEDLLTFRLGFGLVVPFPGVYPIQVEEERLGLATIGPPWPPPSFGPDEWIARFATLPLMEQPGQAWRYNTGAEVLGILIERATRRPLEAFLRERLFDPLGMPDTSFSVPPEKMARFTTAYTPSPSNGQLDVFDLPATGWWSAPPALANVAGMLVSTLDDLWAFVAMLAAGGMCGDRRILSEATVAAMTRNHLTEAQRARTSCSSARGAGATAWRHPSRRLVSPRCPGATAGTAGRGTTWRTDQVRRADGHPAQPARHDLARAAAALHGFLDRAIAAIA